jgi:DNA-binding NtrC family response regulator
MSEVSGNEQIQQSQPSYDILLIEDDIDTGEMLTQSIESQLALRVRSLQSGEEMLQHLRDLRDAFPSLIIIDYLLAGMNGLQLLNHLQSFKNFEHIPVIMITAATITDDMQTALRNRNVSLLTKPFDLTELFDYLEDIRHNAYQQLL